MRIPTQVLSIYADFLGVTEEEAEAVLEEAAETPPVEITPPPIEGS